MYKLTILVIIVIFLAISTTPSFAHSGCCSHHGGVSGCGCADGTPLSNTCAPYYPECYNGGQQQSTEQTQTYVSPTAYPTDTPYPTLIPTIKPKPTVKPIVKKKAVKHIIKKPAMKKLSTPTPTPKKNFFQKLFGW